MRVEHHCAPVPALSAVHGEGPSPLDRGGIGLVLGGWAAEQGSMPLSTQGDGMSSLGLVSDLVFG
ncbi:hypothetical protein AB0C21_07525 [Spirillospora sp. NPDC049024]